MLNCIDIVYKKNSYYYNFRFNDTISGIHNLITMQTFIVTLKMDVVSLIYFNQRAYNLDRKNIVDMV